MPGDMADSIDFSVADEGLLGSEMSLDGQPETLWTNAQNRSTPIVLMGNVYLMNAHRFSKRRGLRPRLVAALAQEIARRGIVLDADDLPTIPFAHTVPVWQDRQGVLHPIPQMETRHLLNAHRFARCQVANGNLALEDAVEALAAEITERGLTPLDHTHATPDDAPTSSFDDELRF